MTQITYRSKGAFEAKIQTSYRKLHLIQQEVIFNLVKQQTWIKTALETLSFGIITTALTAVPVLGAERIAFYYPPFGEFSISTESLEVFAKDGKITNELNFYAKRANPQQLAQLRDLLKSRFEVSPVLVSQFTYSPLGETVIRRLGKVFKTDSRQNGFYALRSAFILAAADPEGLSVLNILRRFPTRSVRLDLNRGLQVFGNLSELLKKRDAVVMAIQQQSTAEASNSQVDFNKQPDLRLAGGISWQKQTLTLKDTLRDRTFPVDLYLPQLGNKAKFSAAPVIVISHGVAEDRTTFAYLAQHLASYGFAVAVLEHPGSNSKRFQEYFTGLAGPPEPKETIDRPLDVKYLLDELQRLSQSDPVLQGRLNLKQVGAIGHSLGGYTVLTLAGAKINFPQLLKDCKDNESLNLSVLVQCRTVELPPLNYTFQDNRVKAIIAINPVTSSILGESGISQIQVPLMIVGGSEDIVTPAIPEQIRPFTWLKTSNKYLVLIEKATHFSALGEIPRNQGALPIPPGLIGPNPEIARLYLKALSVAFFQTHIAQRSEYGSYLCASYAKVISQAPLNLDFVRSLTATQLTQVLDGKPAQLAPSSGCQAAPNTP